MAVNIHKIPDHKRGKAYDAGEASKRHRDVVKRDENGMPVIGDDGRPEQIRVIRPPSQKWVTSTGSVIHVRHTDGAPSRSAPERERSLFVQLHGRQAIRYGLCPVRDTYSVQWIPQSMRESTPCAPGTYGEGQCCHHVEEIIKLRTAQHLKMEARRAEAGKTMHQRQLEQDRVHHGELVQTLINAIGDQRNRNRSRGGDGS